MIYCIRTWHRDGSINRMPLPSVVKNLEKMLIEADEIKIGGRHPAAIERALRRKLTLHSKLATYVALV